MKKYIIISLFIVACKDNSMKKPAEMKGLDYFQFKKNAVNYMKTMDDTLKKFTIPMEINFVKVRNSLSIYNIDMRDSILYQTFIKAFSEKAFEKVITQLEMKLSIGMSYYSKKYDIYLGADESRESSYFIIDSTNLPKLYGF